MITFKQFVAEIDHDDSVYSKRASDHMLRTMQQVDDTWKLLLKIDDNPVVWKKVAGDYKLVMLEKDTLRPMFRLVLNEMRVKVPGGNLTGVMAWSLSSKEQFRGQGYAYKMYEALVKHGQVLFSSTSQTSGSMKLWQQLVQSGVGEPFVLAEGVAARWYTNQYKQHDGAGKVLLTGNFDRMDNEAYASHETRWLIVPHDIAGQFKKKAIKL